MKLKTSPFSILNKERREMEYIKGIYKRRVQAEMSLIKILKMRIIEIQSKLKMY